MKKKKRNVRSITNTILSTCLVILIIVFSGAMYFLANNIFTLKQEINLINSSLSERNSYNPSINDEDQYYRQYVEISEKADAEMSRLVTAVGILATAYTIFGSLIVFKAPNEIDKRIRKLEELVSQVEESADEAKYQAEIIDAVVNSYNGKMTNYDKLRRISAVIERYPLKADAYFQRAFIYDNMKKYDEAIRDYKMGHKYEGVGDASYYSDMGVTYNKKGELSKAISFYSKAIKLTPDDPDIYANRGSCYDDQGKYDLALADYNTAIEIDEDCKQAYINRSITYGKLLDKEDDEEKKKEYHDLLISDLNKALELDPEDLFVKNMLVRRLRTEIDADRVIADIDERIGDIETKEGHPFEAFKHYIDSARYYLIEVLIHGKDCWDTVERLISKIHGIGEKDIIPQIDSISTELSNFCQLLRGIAVQLYVKGKKDIAEKSFLILLSYDTDKGCALNLAFMKRRGETCLTELPTIDLLNQCSNKNDAIWCINKALCYVTGVEGHEINWNEAMNVMRSAQENKGEAVQWWSDVEVVGEAENNMVMVFVNLTEEFSIEDHVSLEDRISQARKDGYHIPEDC